MSTGKATIGLMWHSVASGNLGVGALTVSQVAIVEAAAARLGIEAEFRVLGWKESEGIYLSAPNIRPGRLRSADLLRPGGLWADVRACDFVLDIGAGDSFSDIYGTGRFLRYMAAKNIVHLAGKPLIVSPQTIGPFSRAWVRRVALNTLGRSAAVFARDEASIRFLRDLGHRGHVELASDVALLLPYDPPPDRSGDDRVRVGLNISGLLMNGGYTKANMFGLAVDYPGLMRRVIARFLEKPDCEIHLVPHVLSESMPVEDDWRASERIAAEFGDRVHLAPRFTSPGAAKSYIAGLDFFMGARMHACIAAFSSGVPVVPLAYSRKFSGLFGALGYSYTLDCTTEREEDIEAGIFALFDDRARLETSRRAALERGLERLKPYQAEIESRLRAVLSG